MKKILTTVGLLSIISTNGFASNIDEVMNLLASGRQESTQQLNADQFISLANSSAESAAGIALMGLKSENCPTRIDFLANAIAGTYDAIASATKALFVNPSFDQEQTAKQRLQKFEALLSGLTNEMNRTIDRCK